MTFSLLAYGVISAQYTAVPFEQREGCDTPNCLTLFELSRQERARWANSELGQRLKSLKMLEWLMTRIAKVLRLTSGRAELTLQLGLRRTTERARYRLAAANPR